jgi:hypothetical protein
MLECQVLIENAMYLFIFEEIWSSKLEVHLHVMLLLFLKQD